jgi:hypothetical protein
MHPYFTRLAQLLQQKKIRLTTLCMLCLTYTYAQKDTTHPATHDSTASNKIATRPKEITKLEDLNLPPELVYRIKKMTPNQLVTFREDFNYNIKAEDKIDYTITVRLGFSQDMITGIVKWVPLYNNTDAPPEITKIKVKVQFCCTTKIDTLHKKQHCGKMSELNDFEDNEHCKDWVQKDDAQVEAENASTFGKPTGPAGKGGKKGGVTGSTSPTGEGFGKPSKDDKKKKGKGKEIQEPTDSTNYRPEGTEKPTKEDKKKGKEKESKQAPQTDSTNYRPEGAEKPSKEEKKKKGKEEAKKTDASNEESGYGKPTPLPKEDKKKKSTKEKDNKQATPTDSTNYRPEPPAKDSTQADKGFGKPDDKKSKKKKKG